jgi:hypothetical protein
MNLTTAWDYYRTSKWQRMTKRMPLSNDHFGWATYYDLREGVQAETLCYWHLSLHEFHSK